MFNIKIKNMKTKFKKKNSWASRSFNYTFIIVLLLFSLSITSCTDILEEEVYSSFTADNFFKDPASAELGMFGIYDLLGDDNMYGKEYLLYFQQGSDQARHWRTNRGQAADLLSNYQIFETNTLLGSVWSALYNGVNRANLVIDRTTILRDNIANNPNASSSELQDLEAYNNVLGDAHFLRGFLYFQLTRNWGDVPLRIDSNVLIDDLKVERNPQVQVYEQIEADMLYGISLLPPAAITKSVGRISKGAAQGILARVYLHWAGFPLNDTSKFAKAAEQSLAVIQSGQHGLNLNINKLTIGGNTLTGDDPTMYGPDAYKDYFPETFHNLANSVTDYRESMWEIQFAHPGETVEDAGYLPWYGILQSTSSTYRRGGPRWYSLPSFYDSFAENDTLRRDWSVATFEIKSNDEFTPVDRGTTNAPKWSIGKYRRYLMSIASSPNKNADIMNWPIIRYSDVLLMYAEAVNETSLNGGSLPPGATLASAYDAINEVRRRAMPNSPTNEVDLVGSGGADFREQIRDERGWELCFERIRKADLTRWGILGDKISETAMAMSALGYTSLDSYFQAENFEPKHNLLPIPYLEISQNPEILNTDPTNNGYR